MRAVKFRVGLGLVALVELLGCKDDEILPPTGAPLANGSGGAAGKGGGGGSSGAGQAGAAGASLR